ncbi:DUF4184 family protein [Streptomyces sp. MST-110588]|uniref:DUF4184 family protein n=1 Tax=Streptomyces sp. MST-110588 TaxID=2833628 RepID=UPI001F5C1774|nr:DUF4184 family protein [Streptomyces sp. MST-110588]UNO42669.1 DUF4184 family protein [Streptomyces sp. MST-110588]
MPFTLSHAAAVLPAVRRTGAARGPLIASALVAGSFAPDATYFADSLIPGAMLFGDVTHSPLGALSGDVLITAALVGGWLLLREPVLALLPRSWQGRGYALLRGRSWRGRRPAALIAWFAVSAALGALTHIVWDAFTHADRWGTRLLPVLDRVVAGFPLYTFLQYGSSALALGAIGWFLVTGLRRLPPVPVPPGLPGLAGGRRLFGVALLALCVLAGTVHRTLRAHAVYGAAATWFDYIPTVLFGAGAGLAPGLLLYAVTIRFLARPSRPVPESAAPDRTGAAPADRTKSTPPDRTESTAPGHTGPAN